MTWLEKMDAVLECLYTLKANNPSLDDLRSWLKANYIEVDDGEILDITLYLWREQMMYFETGGNRLAVYNDLDEKGKYLISCKGKLLWDGEGGFKKREIRKIKGATLQSWQTWAIAVGTSFAGLYALIQFLTWLFHRAFSSCH